MKTPKTKNTITMKTLYFFLSFSGLVATTLFAFAIQETNRINDGERTINTSVCDAVHGSTFISESTNCTSRQIDFSELAPTTPEVADFTDVIAEGASHDLSPSTPVEATFEEMNDIYNDVYLENLSPVTPAEADFNDSEILQPADAASLNPVTPAEADFEDLV